MNTGDWNKNLSSMDFYNLQLNDFKDWERDNNNEVYFIELLIVKGKDIDSRDIAIKFDDMAKGYFYYRDWTYDGVPFVKCGEYYKSGFWFQIKEDKELFGKMFL